VREHEPVCVCVDSENEAARRVPLKGEQLICCT